VKTRFQSLSFKCNLYRYTKARAAAKRAVLEARATWDLSTGPPHPSPPPPSPSRAKEEPAASQPPTHDEAAELRAVAQLKDEIREVLHAHGGPTWSFARLMHAYQAHFSQDLEHPRVGCARIHKSRISMADPLVLYWMKRRYIFRTVAGGGGQGRRKKVYNLAALLRSEHFADVVDVHEHEFPDNCPPLLVPAGRGVCSFE
jgi:hypothetical protein